MGGDELIEREVIRLAILAALKNEPRTQYVNLKAATAEVLQSRKLPVVEDGMRRPMGPALRPQDNRRFRETLWGLVNEGILMQGMDDNNPNWPWLSLTEWGEEYLDSATPDIYDSDGYLRALDDFEALDEVERRFLGQALGALRANLPDAAAVMLGAASEQLLIKLAEAIHEADPSTVPTKWLDALALQLLNHLRRVITAEGENLPRDLRENFATAFEGVAALIRVGRNESGHPRAREGAADRNQVALTLQMFPAYRSWIIGLIRQVPSLFGAAHEPDPAPSSRS